MSDSDITIFMCGDVMTGRGIDQVLPHPCDPRIHEPYVRDARTYVDLAQDAHGVIPRPVGFTYIWGDALEILERARPDVRLVNLETAVTACDAYWPGKGINYRMHPRNVPVLTAARVDVCTLANNHVLDWGYEGLAETLATLDRAGLKVAGAGRNLEEAAAPAVVEVAGKGRVLVFGLGSTSSGIPAEWGATAATPGVNLLFDPSEGTVRGIAERVRGMKRRGDIVVTSIHWGGNWGFGVDREETAFAHRLVDAAGVDVIHGHSSHHVKGVEVYRGRPVIYGCGDFVSDYEGIAGYEAYRGELGLMYFVTMDPASGTFAGLRMIPTRMERFRVNRAAGADAAWLAETLNREGRRLGTRVERDREGALMLRW